MNINCALLIITDKISFCVILAILQEESQNKGMLIWLVEKYNSTVDLTGIVVKDLNT
jgi:hypothetical protein